MQPFVGLNLKFKIIIVFVGVIISAAKKHIRRGFRKSYINTSNVDCENIWSLYQRNLPIWNTSEINPEKSNDKPENYRPALLCYCL